MSDAAYTLKLRSLSKGGEPVFPEEKEFEHLALCPNRRMLLLIHGYNNNRTEANEAYDGFERMQCALAGDPANGDYAPGTQTVRVYWPGDADWGVWSVFFFLQAIGHAEQSGALLAQALEKHANGAPLFVDIVAHSLGCRVVYEMLAALSETTNVQVQRIVLFAGAVATFMLEPGEGQGFDAAYDKRVSDGLLSLYSGSDRVLSLAFPVGSTLAPGPQGFFPTALGHDLWISSRAPLTMDQAVNRNAGHSDYWGWKADTRESAGRFANQSVRDFLRFVTAAPRRTPVVDALVRTGAEVREIAGRRAAERETQSRRIDEVLGRAD